MISAPVFCRRFIGRRTQLEFLSERFREATSGRGSIVVVSGEAGAGKSRLLTEFCGNLDLRAVWFAKSDCLEYAQSPFAPFLRVLHVLEPSAPGVRLGSAPQDNSFPGEGDKLQQLDEMADAIRRLVKSRPTLIVIEDVHWADAASVELLQYIGSSVATMSLMLVVTCRSEELHDAPKLRATLAKLERGHMLWRCDLEPLSDGEMQALIDHALADRNPLPMQTLHNVRTRAEGNPLFAEELLKSAIEGGSSGGLSERLPGTVREAVLERLARFDDSERSILVHAAAIGPRFEPHFLAETVVRPVDDIVRVLKRALNLQLLVESGPSGRQYAFRHALTAQAIYGELIAAQAELLHGRIAAALEATSPESHIAELAYHWWRARDIEKTALFNERAGDAAVALNAFDDAVITFERVIATGLLQGASLARVEVKLASSLSQCGSGERARHLYESALAYYEAAEDPESAAHMFLNVARVYTDLGDSQAAIQMAERALGLTKGVIESPFFFAAHVQLAFIAYYLRDDITSALEHIDLADRFTGPRAALPSWAGIWFHLIRSQDKPTARVLDDIHKAVEIAERAGDWPRVVHCWTIYGSTMADRGEQRLAHEAYARALALAREKRLSRHFAAWLFLACADIDLQHGELENARDHIREALATNIETARLRSFINSVGMSIGVRLKDADLVRRCAQLEMPEFDSLTADLVHSLAVAFGNLFLSQARPEEAALLFHRANLALAMLAPVDDKTGLFILLAEHGNEVDIPLARTQLERVANGFNPYWMPAYAALFDALVAQRLNDKSEAIAKASAAATSFEDLQWPLFRAKALEVAGQQAQALEIYRRCGDLWNAERLDAKINPVNRRGRSKTQLTDREKEIAALVATGKANRVIADELVISERTVESHIAAILRKLGFTTRVELATYVARNPVSVER